MSHTCSVLIYPPNCFYYIKARCIVIWLASNPLAHVPHFSTRMQSPCQKTYGMVYSYFDIVLTLSRSFFFICYEANHTASTCTKWLDSTVERKQWLATLATYLGSYHCIRGIVISTSHLLYELWVSEHITCMNSEQIGKESKNTLL